MKRALLAVIVCLLFVANALVLVPGDPGAPTSFPVRASTITQTVANTTATWDAGAKASTSTTTDTCENVTANALQLNNTGNYQGIGLTTNTTNCATGAWGVSASGLLLSYDMEHTRSGRMKDFGPGSNDGVIGGAVPTSGKYGLAQSFDGVRENVTAARTITQNSSFTVSFWAKVTGGASTFRSPVNQMSPLGPSGWIIYATTLNIWSFWVWQGGTWGTNDLAAPAAIGTWFFFTAKWDATTHTSGFSVNNTALKWASISTPIPWSLCPLNIGKRASTTCQDSAFAFPGIVDELLVFNRNLTASENTALYTDGRSSFLSSGSWSSPVQSTPGLVPQLVHVQASGVTAPRQLAYLDIVNRTGGVIWNGSSYNAAGSNFYTFVVPRLGEALKGWGVRFGLVGDGAGTAAVLSLTVDLVPPTPSGGSGPPFSLTCTFNPLLVSWTCADYTNYSGYAVFGIAWSYDGSPVTTSAANALVTFRAPGQSWLSAPSDHMIGVVASTASGSWTYALPVHSSLLVAQLIALVVVLLVLGVAASMSRSARDRNVYFMPFENPGHRDRAISVEEYPKGWRSYRQKDPDRYTRFRSVRRGNVWVVYGIRPATAAEQQRTGRKYIAEVQTVRERL